MLSNLPKLLDRAFILGYFMPALLFAVAALLLLRDYAFASQWLDALLAKDVTSAAYAAAAVWLLAILLLLFNLPTYRLLEGYLPPLSWRTGARRRFWQRIHGWQAEAAALRDRFDDLTVAESARYNELRLRLSGLPGTEGDILPTRFGNAIKSFETYARDIYGADGVVLWLRLLPVVSKEFATAVQDVRTEVDFHVNCCILAFVLAVVAFVVAVLQTPFSIVATEFSYAGSLSHLTSIPTSRGMVSIWWPLLGLLPFGKLLWAAAALLASGSFYHFAVKALPAWGNLVMTGFDCYLPKLAEQLGFTLPRNDADRRRFWQQFSALVTYRPLPGEPAFFKAENWLFPPRH